MGTIDLDTGLDCWAPSERVQSPAVEMAPDTLHLPVAIPPPRRRHGASADPSPENRAALTAFMRKHAKRLLAAAEELEG